MRENRAKPGDAAHMPLYEARMGSQFAQAMSANGQQQGTAGVIRQVVIDLSVLTAVGIVLGILAPLGTGYMTLAPRIGYWVVLAWAGYLFYKPIGTIVVGMRDRLDLPGWLLWTLSVMIGTVPMSVVVWLVNNGGQANVPSLEVALSHYFAVGVVGAVVTLLFNLFPATAFAQGEPSSEPRVAQDAVQPPAPKAPEPPQSANPLLDQLPAALGSDVIALEMEDHYVRVHTAHGSELVLMRLRDAMAHVAHIDGRQVHRSWWVARLAVEDVKREGRNIRLVLPGELEAPVARAQVSELKDAGWF